MKWWIVVSLSGAALSVAAAVLSLVFGPALPISPVALAVTVAPGLLIGFLALRGTDRDRTYRTLHRFSRAAKNLLLLEFHGTEASTSDEPDVPARRLLHRRDRAGVRLRDAQPTQEGAGRQLGSQALQQAQLGR